ncbi:MAG: metallophosphoesterase [Pseudomonadota bacterium]
MKLVVLSDLHIMPSGHPNRGPDTHGRLQSAITRINTAYSDADLVVVAGDVADWRRAPDEGYGEIKAALETLQVPWTATIGNHDRRDAFLASFGPGFGDENGFAQSAHILGDHRVIVLDSLKLNTDPASARYSAPTGELCAARLAWLDARLARATGHPVIVILHHHVRPAHILMDAAGLEDPDPFIDRLVAHGGVRQVISGHIHMATTTFHRGIPFTTLAGGFSTSIEDFGRRENKFRREGPAQMAVVLSDTDQTTVHFDNYVDANPLVTGR